MGTLLGVHLIVPWQDLSQLHIYILNIIYYILYIGHYWTLNSSHLENDGNPYNGYVNPGKKLREFTSPEMEGVPSIPSAPNVLSEDIHSSGPQDLTTEKVPMCLGTFRAAKRGWK